MSIRSRGSQSPCANSVAAAALTAKGIANDERGFLMTGNGRFIEEADRRVQRARASFAVSAAAASGRGQQDAVAEARAGFERWVSAVRREFAAFRSGDRRGPTAASLGPNRALRKRYEAARARAQALGIGAIRRRMPPSRRRPRAPSPSCSPACS